MSLRRRVERLESTRARALARLRARERATGPIVAELRAVEPGRVLRFDEQGLCDYVRGTAPVASTPRGIVAVAYLIGARVADAVGLPDPDEPTPSPRLLAAGRAAALEADRRLAEVGEAAALNLLENLKRRGHPN